VATPATTPVASAPVPVTAAPAIPEKSVAVLPFVNMSEDKNNEYFSDGLSEELIDLLTKVPDLQVPARTSSFYFKGKQATVAEIAKALGVSHVLGKGACVSPATSSASLHSSFAWITDTTSGRKPTIGSSMTSSRFRTKLPVQW
jgi:hypothetical protein